MIRMTTFAALCLLVFICGEAAAQTPTPTPRPTIRIPGRPASGGTGASSASGSSSGTSNSSASGGQNNTLVCRMGGNMVWTLVNQFEVVQTQINGKNVRVPVIDALFDQLKFARSGATVSPDAANLQPGSCGFTDRALSSSDPDTVIADDDGFTFQETVLWGNGSTIRGETTMGGGSLSFQNKQAFSMQVMLWNGVQWKVVPGTKPKALN